MLQLLQKNIKKKSVLLIVYYGMPCQNIKTLKINQGNGLLQIRLSGSVQFWYIIKQNKMLTQVWEYGSMGIWEHFARFPRNAGPPWLEKTGKSEIKTIFKTSGYRQGLYRDLP